MKPDFKFNKIEVNGVKITDTTVYLDDSTDEFVFKQFKSNEVYVIDIMEKHYINKESDYQFNITDSFGSSIFTNLLDGWFTIHHLIIPNEDYYNRIKNNGIIWTYSNFYYSDGNKIYKSYNGNSTEVDIRIIFENNEVNDSILNRCGDYFSIYELDKLFIDKAAEIFNSDYHKNKKKLNEDKFQRDMYWSAKNTVRYYVELQELEKAELLINKILKRNGKL